MSKELIAGLLALAALVYAWFKNRRLRIVKEIVNEEKRKVDNIATIALRLQKEMGRVQKDPNSTKEEILKAEGRAKYAANRLKADILRRVD